MSDRVYYDTDDVDEAKEPFLGNLVASRHPPKLSLSWKLVLFLHWIAISILWFTAFAFYTQTQRTTVKFTEEVYSPAQHIIRSENVVFTSGFGRGRTEYMGEPNPQNEAAWSDLYNFGISRIPRSSAAQLVNKTIPIPNDPGYYAVSLNVFHQLHCLNMIRKRLYINETYDREDEIMGMDHIEHCIDAVRQGIMCASDITPLPWTWVEADQEAKEVADVIHTCRNFEDIRGWGMQNVVKYFDRHTFVHDELRVE